MLLNDSILGQRFSNLALVLVLLFPIFINSVKIFSSLILLFLVVLGCYIAISDKLNPFKIKELKLLSWLTVGYFVVMLLSIVIADGIHAEFHHLGRKLQFLLAPFIALAIYKINIPLKSLLLSIKIGLVIIGAIVIIQSLLGYDRPSGMMNQNIFGDIAVAMLFLSIVRVFEEEPKERVITFSSIVFGLFAIVLSGNRGSWISALILGVFYFGIIYKRYLFNNTKLKLITFGLLAIILTSIINTQTFNRQILNTETAIERWLDGNIKQSSVGERLNMWISGLKAFRESPLIGYGYRNANKAAQKYTSKDIAGYTHLHNEYLTNLVSAGIIGLLSLLALIFLPMLVFYRKLKDKASYYYALMGMMLCIGYATFGFSHIAFGEEHINAFYVLFISFLLPKAIRIDST